jgi:hypothetical protein
LTGQRGSDGDQGDHEYGIWCFVMSSDVDVEDMSSIIDIELHFGAGNT